MKKLLAILGTTAVVGTLGVLGITNATAATAPAAALNPDVAPGGNFNLGVWQLQLPIGSPGSPTTIPSSQLKGAERLLQPGLLLDRQDRRVDDLLGAGEGRDHAELELRALRTARDERERQRGRLAAGRLRTSSPPPCASRASPRTSVVGQIHLGTGGPSTKPLVELYYRPNGDIYLGTENSPDGGQTLHKVGNVPLGTKWNYVIAVSGGNNVKLTVNGTTTSYAIPSSFNPYGMYFKAGSYNQSSSQSTTNGAKVKFYALTITHG